MKEIYLEMAAEMTLDDCLKEFEKHRAKIKKPITPLGLHMAKRKAMKYGADETEAKAIILQSIDRGWQGVFPLKDEESDSTDLFGGF